jgi:hypothetical protein
MSLAAALLLGAALLPASALGVFGIHDFDVAFTADPQGTPATQAGSHPYAMKVSFKANTTKEGGKTVPDEAIKDVIAGQPVGFAGTPAAVPTCSTLDFLTTKPSEEGHPPMTEVPACSDSSAVGVITIFLQQSQLEKGVGLRSPVYLLEPAPGEAAKLGFIVEQVPIPIDVELTETPPYRILGISSNISQVLDFFGAELTFWGDPTSDEHDKERGRCYEGKKSCPAGFSGPPFITLPRACSGPLRSTYEVDSWQNPGAWKSGFALTHDPFGNPRGLSGCGRLGFSPSTSARPTTDQASAPSGLAFSLDVDDEELANPKGIAQSDIKEMVLTLPKGVTANPSVAEGLKACSEDQLAAEKVSSGPGEGCPEASKVGSLEVETPLLPNETLHGAVYIATPYENPFHSLLALYLVIKSSKFGVVVKQPAKVEPDPKTGQLITTVQDLPQFPLSHVEARLREGGRGLLISPPGCGHYETVAKLIPWADPTSSLESVSSFQISHGAGGASCPPAGTPPFAPGFTAGALDNTAGAYSPFFMRLTRPDGNQDIVRFDALLPPGVAAKLAGVSQCSDVQIASARAKTGHQEQASPSCPANSLIGRVEGGAGVGSQLTYVPGRLYLAGPTNGAPLSVVAIVPAVAGPFDVGNVVVRQALRVNPRSGQASVDSAASDAIPHILAGIPLAVRDIRVHVDRPEFTINPTRCVATATAASIWGGGSDPFSTADDSPISRLSLFQAASCGSLPFKPSLSLALKGGTKRGAHPALRVTYKPKAGDANLRNLVLRLPHSAFLEQGHIKTVCTRVQYAAKACPPGSIYGKVSATTPLFSDPLTGPLYLRSSNHNLPDLVLSLHGIVDIEAVVRVDSKNGGIRTSLEETPDAPLTKAIVEMPAGKKGLVVNSTNLCAAEHRAKADLEGQNGAKRELNPLVKPSGCGAPGKKRRAGHKHSR